jgi:uncharacterized membrane protein
MTYRRGDGGQTSLLIVGFFLVAVLLVVVVVDASAAYLRRQELDALADGAALAAADAVREEAVYTGGLGDLAQLDPVSARAQVAAYLVQVGARHDYAGLRYTVTASNDSVQVRVTTPLELPFDPPGWSSHAEVTGRAVAIVRVGE